MKINKIEVSTDLENLYILVTLTDKREIFVRLKKEQNRPTCSINIDQEACDEDEKLDSDEISEILAELRDRFKQKADQYANYEIDKEENLINKIWYYYLKVYTD